MHFGRLAEPTGVDFALPPDPVRTERFLALASSETTRMHVGCPIWAEKRWVGDLYPTGTKAAAFLRTYARHFSCVELNSTFYQLLPPDRLQHWAYEVPPDFRFCPKVYRGISESLASADLRALIQTYCASIAAFADNLGLAFMQLPETFSPAHGEVLQRFLQLWPTAIDLAIEFRHPGWFDRHALIDPAVNLLYRHRVATVITDTPGRRDVLHLSLTQPRVLIRFQGTNTPVSDRERLATWAQRLRTWENRHLADIYLFAHQPDPVTIPQTADAFAALWRQAAH